MASKDQDSRADGLSVDVDAPSAKSPDAYPKDHAWTLDPDCAAGLPTPPP